MTRLFILLAISILCSISCGDSSAAKSATGTTSSDSTTPAATSFEGQDRKPRFGGCDEIKDPAELKSCNDKKLAKFISTNLQYPDNARKMKIQGKAIISFVIEPNGSISDISALSNLGGGLEEEALRVFHLMNEKKMWWVAGMKNGKHQRVQLQLPITFKL